MIYFLEDDSSIRSFVLYALSSSGLPARGFEFPSELYPALTEKLPDLLLLDIMLPEEDGLSILKKLRADPATKRLPVILLTARGTEFDKVTGLDSGADDYISKPFSTLELISRVKALLRRTREEHDADDYITAGAVKLSPSKHEVIVGDTKINLTLKEYELLLTLMKGKGQVFSRDALLPKVWGYDFSGESRTVDVHIRTLRSKLGAGGEVISTIRGVGYKINMEDEK